MMSIDNSEDIIDSRDVIKRIAELESERNDLVDSVDSGEEFQSELDLWDDDEGMELKSLLNLASQCEGYSDWEYGEALIRDSYFRDYAEQLADDIGAINSEAHWPNNCIDWDKAARELQMDYMCVDFDGVDYWMRA